MYDLHIANKNYSSWSLRPWVLLKALGIPFTEHQHYFSEGPDFKSFSPTALVPALVDGGTTVWDSLAIAEYVFEDHTAVWPRDRSARAFARSAAAEMHSGFTVLRSVCSMNIGIRLALKDTPPQLLRDLSRLDDLWTQGLERFGGPYLAGAAFTAADAFFAPVAFRIQTYGLEAYFSDASSAYAERLLALPAMRQWYEAGLAETQRHLPHEIGITDVGTVTADFRAK